MSEISERLGERIRSLREAAGLSQEELAAASGVSRVHLSSLERGAKEASVSTCARIAKALRVPLAKLLDLDEKVRAVRPAERLALKVAAYAEGAAPAEIERAERLMKVFFGR